MSAVWLHHRPPRCLTSSTFHRSLSHWQGCGYSHVVIGFAARAARREATIEHHTSLRLAVGSLLVAAPLMSLLWCHAQCIRTNSLVLVLAAVLGVWGSDDGFLAWVSLPVLLVSALWLALAVISSASVSAVERAHTVATRRSASASSSSESSDDNDVCAAELVSESKDSLLPILQRRPRTQISEHRGRWSRCPTCQEVTIDDAGRKMHKFYLCFRCGPPLIASTRLRRGELAIHMLWEGGSARAFPLEAPC